MKRFDIVVVSFVIFAACGEEERGGSVTMMVDAAVMDSAMSPDGASTTRPDVGVDTGPTGPIICEPPCSRGQTCNGETGQCQGSGNESPLCNDNCSYAFDGTCDDGGPACDFSLCDFGSDCGDCGMRREEDRPAAGAEVSCPCGVACADDQFCNDETSMCESCSCDGRQCGSPNFECPSCGECGADTYCDDAGQCASCECGDRNCGSSPVSFLCDCGTCTDAQYCDDMGHCQACECGSRTCGRPHFSCDECGTCADMQFCSGDGQCMARTGPELCNNTCSYAGDGDCDDGGPMCDYSLCAFGSDCLDCGMRTEAERGMSGMGCSGDAEFK